MQIACVDTHFIINYRIINIQLQAVVILTALGEYGFQTIFWTLNDLRLKSIVSIALWVPWKFIQNGKLTGIEIEGHKIIESRAGQNDERVIVTDIQDLNCWAVYLMDIVCISNCVVGLNYHIFRSNKGLNKDLNILWVYCHHIICLVIHWVCRVVY